MSKTVKRAMRVMMIGLVALLGANAEAHYFVVSGKYKYCSVCVDADFEDHVPGAPPHTDEAEFVVTIATGEILCSNNTIPTVGNVILRVRKPIVQGNTTEATLTGAPITTTKVEAVLSDAAFDTLNVCASPLTKIDTLIREMSVEINTYCDDPDPTTGCKGLDEPFDTDLVTCNLSNTFNLRNYPLNLPPPGTPYRCQ